MIAIPAIDLRDGACVQLVGGSYEAERVRVDDPIRQAERFRDAGFQRLHVVDLDAATGRGSNREIVDALLALEGIAVQVGGGIRTVEQAAALLGAGADAVVVGTRALEAPELLRDIASIAPGRLVLALDVRGTEVLTRGWSRGTGRSIFEVVEAIDAAALAGILVTAVHVEGTMTGPDVALYESIAIRSRQRVFASGGIGSSADLDRLESIGTHAAIVGMALYTGALDPRAIARRYRAEEGERR